MKTYKHLWEPFISKENFELAYLNSIKGKSKQNAVKAFKENWEKNLEAIRQMVIHGEFHTSPYREKVIFEPKKRIIYKLPYSPDRIVQHAVMNILRPIMTKLSIEHSYACIEDKGQIKASQKCSEFVRKYDRCLKCDIRKFYPSIDQKMLSDELHRYFKDEKFMAVVDDIVFSFPGGMNCPIGNYTSQWFGNFYLRKLDNYVLHTIKPSGYLRYCDDFLLFDNSKEKLQKARKYIEEYLWQELCLEYSRDDLFKTAVQGVDFCGYRHFKDYVLLRKRTAKRLKKRYLSIEESISGTGKDIPQKRMVGQVASGNGLLKHACTYHLKTSIHHDLLAKKLGIKVKKGRKTK